MHNERNQHQLVLLPDGWVMAIGGKTLGGPSYCDMCPYSVYEAERIDPVVPAQGWQPLASMTIPRAHHSTAMLLPDATVLSAGEPDLPHEFVWPPIDEIFTPPELDPPPINRPNIGLCPGVITMGASFNILVQGIPASQIVKVALVRLGAVTHSFDQNQRYVPLEFAEISPPLTPGNVNVTAPADGYEAPPGYYMLFVVSNLGVPSTARYVRLEEHAIPPGGGA